MLKQLYTRYNSLSIAKQLGILLLFNLVQNDTPVKISVGLVDGFIGWIGKALMDHYLPALKEAKKAEKRSKSKPPISNK